MTRDLPQTVVWRRQPASFAREAGDLLGREDACPHRKQPLCKGRRKGDMALADPTDIFAIQNYCNPAWGINRGAAMELDCNYLLLCDSLLDPTHVAWVQQSSFATAATKDTPLWVTNTDDGS